MPVDSRDIKPFREDPQDFPLGYVVGRLYLKADNDPMTLPDGTSGYRFLYGQSGGALRKFRVVKLYGLCLAAGSGTFYLQRYRWSDPSGGSGIITDTIDISALADGSTFTEATIDDDYYTIDPAENDELQLVVAGGNPDMELRVDIEILE